MCLEERQDLLFDLLLCGQSTLKESSIGTGKHWHNGEHWAGLVADSPPLRRPFIKGYSLNSSVKRRRLLLIAVIVAVSLAVLTQVMKQVGRVDSAALISEAEAALKRQDLESAGTLLDRVLAQEPTNALALIQRGKLWASIGNFESALQDWRGVQADGQSNSQSKLGSEALALEGALQVDLHRAQDAEKALRASWELYKADENLSTLELLLRIYVVQMRREEIRSVLEVIETYRPLALEELVLRADAGAPIIAAEDAIEQLKAFVAGDPADQRSLEALVRYLMSKEKFAEAETVLNAVPRSLAQSSAVVGLKALCQFKLGRPADALESLALLATADNGKISYWWWMAAGELAEANQQSSLAAECFGFACQAQPDAGYARYRYGLALRAAGQNESSVGQLQVAAAIDRLHQQTEAITRMTNLAPRDFVNGLVQIAGTLRDLQSEEEAAGWARFALQVDPTDRDAQALSRLASSQSASNALVLGESDVAAVPDSVSQQATRQRLQAWLASRAKGNRPLAEKSSPADKIQPSFKDVHQLAQLDFQYFNGNSGFKYLIEAMGGGISLLDYDNDGWPDCYFPQGCKLPINLQSFEHLDQLYRNQSGQRFANVTNAARLMENGYSQGAATADLDNDGFADVVVANFGRNRVFMNQGDGTFRDATEQWGMEDADMSSSLALADFDLDGNLDLYVVNYVDELRVCRGSDGKVSTCNPQNFKGVQDRLFQNSGDGHFIDVTAEAGVLAEDGKGLGVVATDFDDDGLPDIYVSNDTTANFLFKNLGGMRFEEIGLASGTALSDEGEAQAGMGVAAGDLNGDLASDLFVTNFYLEANNLYLNHGSMSFKDEAMQAKLSLPSKRMLGFGTQAEDFDLDGDLDLIVANGHIDDFTSRGDPWKMPTQLFRNLRDGTFEDCSSIAGPYFSELHLGRGVASCDWNRDGRPDFIVVHQDAPCALLENTTNVQNQSIRIRLVGRTSNRDGIGAKVLFKSRDGTQRRDLKGGDGFYATNEKVLIVGLPETVCDVETTWGMNKRQDKKLQLKSGEFMLINAN